MKHLLTFIMSCYIMAMNAQSTFEYLNVNNIKAGFSAYGHLFYDVDSQRTKKFHINDAQSNSAFTINEASLWIAGLDNLGGLSASGEQCPVYEPIFQPGPVGNNYITVIQPGVFDSTYDNTYRKVWKISKAEIDIHIASYNDVGYNIPWAIANWPGNGNTLNGESARLAPFNDINGNNIYEPVYGEYPLICGDEAVYFIYNDFRSHNTMTSLLPLFFEIHGMAFAFKDSANEDLFNTVFVNYKLFNKSNYDYNTIFAGVYTDFDITNNFLSTYVGSDTTLNAFFSYVTKPDTSSNAAFGLYSPSQGVVFLDKHQSNFSCFGNDFTVIGNPSSHNHIYNYLTSRYKDGTHFKIDCDPYNGGTVNTNYAFFDDPNDSLGFSQIACNYPLLDIRGLGTVNTNLIPVNGSFGFTIALVFQKDSLSSNSHLKSVTKLKQRIQNIQNYYNQGLIGCPALALGVEEKVESKIVSLNIYPNPASQIINIQTNDVQSLIKGVMMLDVMGKVMSTNNTPQPPSKGDSSALIDISTLPNGLYFLHIEMSNGQRVVRKVVKE